MLAVRSIYRSVVGFEPIRKLLRPLGRDVAYLGGCIAVFALSASMHELGPPPTSVDSGIHSCDERTGVHTAMRDLPGHDASREPRYRTSLFFCIQAVGILLEGLLKALTGRRVSGWAGRCWTIAFFVSFGAFMLEEWCALDPLTWPFTVSSSWLRTGFSADSSTTWRQWSGGRGSVGYCPSAGWPMMASSSQAPLRGGDEDHLYHTLSAQDTTRHRKRQRSDPLRKAHSSCRRRPRGSPYSSCHRACA
jgi:hypothetical protein